MVETDVLVINEISIIENHHLERLNEVIKEGRWFANQHRKRVDAVTIRNVAFGEYQIIVTGDFYQLPLARPFGHYIECSVELV